MVGWNWHGTDEFICGAICIGGFVSFYKSNYNAGNMYAKWLQKHCTKQCSISRLFNSHPTQFTIWSWIYHSYLSPSATYRPVMWSVGWQNSDVKGLYYIPFLIIMQHYESVIILIWWFIINVGNSCAAYFLFCLFIYLLEPVIFFVLHW